MKSTALFLLMASVACAQTPTKPVSKPAPPASHTPAKPATGSQSTTKPGTGGKGAAATPASKQLGDMPAVPGVPQALSAESYVDITVGTGKIAEAQKFYHVRYTGYLATTGQKFDSSEDHRRPQMKDGKPLIGPDGKPVLGDAQPVVFQQGRGSVIPGLDLGLDGMHVGGKRRLFIPWQLAFGTRNIPGSEEHAGIPPKSDLIFDVELVDVTDMPIAPARPATPQFAETQSAAPPPLADAPQTPSTPPQPRAANNRNFEKAITAYYGEGSFCSVATMDKQLRASYIMPYGGADGETVPVKLDKLFVRAGLLTIVSQNVVGNQVVFQFALTPMGREFYRTGIGDYGNGFCYGTPVVQVVDFTDPGPNGTSSRVTFKYRLRVSSWLTGEIVQEFRNSNFLPAGVDADAQGTASLILMGSGWKVESME